MLDRKQTIFHHFDIGELFWLAIFGQSEYVNAQKAAAGWDGAYLWLVAHKNTPTTVVILSKSDTSNDAKEMETLWKKLSN
ncbi:MAG: hypothetical protein KDD48_09415, partial [Bdellovibrionales bacterium]|nr:hypothetical protein [Bdellovibrionales bacterium]